MKTHIAILVLGAIGSIFMIGATMKIIGNILFLRHAHTAEGTVVNLKTKRIRSRRSYTVYIPIIEFEPNTNRRIRITATVGANPPDYQIGDFVRVRFLPKRPGGGKIQSFWEMWFVPTVCLAVGLTLLGIAILILLN